MLKTFLMACKKGNLKKVKKLYNLINTDKLTEAFYVACAHSQKKTVQYLANRISKQRHLAVHVFNHLNQEHKKTPLNIAVENNDIEGGSFWSFDKTTKLCGCC